MVWAPLFIGTQNPRILKDKLPGNASRSSVLSDSQPQWMQPLIATLSDTCSKAPKWLEETYNSFHLYPLMTWRDV